ncbi:hypothetical protein HYALB_00000759 [Hymenoscyphus albidus]|uniref:Flavin-nucleotide-binding protein n=1 Tax=Hymenoscyphus albidus TaxID=595503 RepID=A0A9N9LRH2_9HELO|nr:hypothetical protein HYALB_00000759 [Hymenoscyphus albidus]
MNDPNPPSYPKLPRNTVQRYKARGTYDYQTIHKIINTTPLLHVSFNTPSPDDPFPAILPMIGFMGSFTNPSASLSEPLDLYLHGYISSRLMRLSDLGTKNKKGEEENEEEEQGLPLTISATHLDGLVLALTPNAHSYNYRSAILHGYATPVLNNEEKLWAMERLTNSVIPDRWKQTRVPPTKAEMMSTQILRVRVVDASAKVRAGEPHDDRKDMGDEEVRRRVWTGVVPTWVQYGEPKGAGGNLVDGVPEYIAEFVRRGNEGGRRDAEEAMRKH